MKRQDKELVVAELTERLRSSQALVVADYRGLHMTEIDGLRPWRAAVTDPERP